MGRRRRRDDFDAHGGRRNLDDLRGRRTLAGHDAGEERSCGDDREREGTKISVMKKREGVHG
jgi:hypothetical protein